MSSEPSSHPVAAPAAKAPSNIFVRHWRGELPLAVSFWGVGIAITVVFMSAEYPLRHLKLGGPVLVAAAAFIFVSACAATVWHFVGTWRSAGRRIGEGRRVWPWMARLAMVAYLALSVGQTLQIASPVVKQAMGFHNIEPLRLRMTRDGTIIELSGGLPPGATKEFADALRAAPSVTTVHLFSDGGRMVEGEAIASLIKERGLDTHTSGTCSSACVSVFMAGKQRTVSPNARLGFHSVSFGPIDSRQAPELNHDVEARLREFGVPDWFITKASSTPSKKIWFPTHQQLMEVNIVTAVVNKTRFPMSRYVLVGKAAEFEAALLAHPYYRTLHDLHPTHYLLARDMLLLDPEVGHSAAEVEQRATLVYLNDLPVFLEVAPNEELVAYWQVRIRDLLALRSRPAACVDFLFPGMLSVDNPRIRPHRLSKRETDALIAVLTAALKSPIDRNSEKRNLGPLLDRVVETRHLYREVIDDFEAFMHRPKLLCAAFSTADIEALKLPPEEAGRYLRHLTRYAGWEN